MSKKKTSLQEFFRNHGSAVPTHNNLPVRPRSDRDDDQGLHLRLAQSCSLDSGRAYSQRYGHSKEGPYAERGSYGSSDALGDVDYAHRPYSHHTPAGPYHSDSHHARKPGHPPRGPSPHDRPAQHGYGAAGDLRAPVSPAGMPSAGGPPGAGPMAPPVHPGSYGAGPYGPPPPEHAYGPPPAHPYGPPGPYAAPPVPGVGLHGGPVPLHVFEHPMASGPRGYGMAPPVYGMPPPPPPPPRQLPPQQALVEASAAASGFAPGGDAGRLAAAAPVETRLPPLAGPVAPRAEPTGPGDRRAALAVQAPSASAVAAGPEKITPFAAAAPEPAAAEPAGPKNEFAERLAQRAMASAARAKSSLLAGADSGALSSAGSLGRADSLARRSSARSGSVSVDIPAAAAVAGPDSSGSTPTEGAGVFVKPSHPFGRPKLALKPRAVPADAAAAASGDYSCTSSDSGDAPADHGSGSAASSLSGGRPRLHLLPRGASLADSSAGAGSAAAGARKPSVFGDAKPRELNLKQRGLDPALVDAAVEVGGGRNGGLRQGSSGDRHSTSPARRRADEDEWHTVGGHGRKAAAADEGRAADLGFDPFFGSSSSSSSTARPVMKTTEYAAVPPARAFSRDIMREGYGGAGGPQGGTYGVAAEGEDDRALFRRALPTRQVPIML